MSVVSIPAGSILVVQYQVGVTDTGSPITRQKSLSGIKPAASTQDIYDVAASLFDLLQLPLVSVRRDDRSDLINQ